MGFRDGPHWKLNKMIVLDDDNGISDRRPDSLADSVDQVKRFKSAAGGRADRRHRSKAIAAAITARRQQPS